MLFRSVAVLCGDNRVWDAMMLSGTPCPYDGLVGDAARDAWIKKNPERFEKLYGAVPPLTTTSTKPDKE